LLVKSQKPQALLCGELHGLGVGLALPSGNRLDSHAEKASKVGARIAKVHAKIADLRRAEAFGRAREVMRYRLAELLYLPKSFVPLAALWAGIDYTFHESDIIEVQLLLSLIEASVTTFDAAPHFFLHAVTTIVFVALSNATTTQNRRVR